MTPESATVALVMSHEVAEAAGLLQADGVHAAPAPVRRAGRVDGDAVIDLLDMAGREALVLARPPWADPAMAPLAAISIVLGHDLLWLPPEVPAAGWAAALIAAWARDAEPDDLLRRAQVAVGLAAMSPVNLPLRPWGEDEVMVPAVGADALARWCDCAWRPCRWCGAGGAADAPCPSCGERAETP